MANYLFDMDGMTNCENRGKNNVSDGVSKSQESMTAMLLIGMKRQAHTSKLVFMSSRLHLV